MIVKSDSDTHFSPYITFSREAWARLRAGFALPLAEDELHSLYHYVHTTP